MNQRELICKVCDGLKEILLKKDSDYGSSFSKSYEEYGILSGLFRLDDKMNRLKNLVKGNKPKVDESIDDTLQDLMGYAGLILIERIKESLALNDNKLVIVSGPSGSGKTTIMRSILNNEIVSFTTRPKREGEVEGRDYIFITEGEFKHLLENDGLIEDTYYGGNYYGVTKKEFDTKINKGTAFIVADYVGMKQFKELYPNSMSIFIYSDIKSVEKNMRNRGDSEEQISKRLSTYEQEISSWKHYDYVVVNEFGKLEEAVRKVRAIVCGGIK